MTILGYMAAPLPVYIAHRAARSWKMKVSPCISVAYWTALYLPWFYLMARIDGGQIPRGVTIALYVALYMLWIGMIGLYIWWGFNSIEYSYAYEERMADGGDAVLRTTVAFVAAIVACFITLIYSLFGLIFERFSSFGEGGNKVKQMLVPTSRDALPYAVGAMWIPLLFSTGFLNYMTMLAIVFAAWRIFCRHGGERRAVNADQQARVPDWREALPFAFFAYWILMFPAMWGISYGITPQ